MPRLLTGGSWPATERRYVPDAHSSDGYREKEQIISMIRVLEEGPDVAMTVFVRGIPCGRLSFPAREEQAVLSRLFRDAPLEDRAAVMELLQRFEDAILAGDVEPKRMAWRAVMAAFDVITADLHALSGLPIERRGAA